MDDGSKGEGSKHAMNLRGGGGFVTEGLQERNTSGTERPSNKATKPPLPYHHREGDEASDKTTTPAATKRKEPCEEATDAGA